MTRFTTLASVAVFTLVLATGMAGALEPIGGLNDTITSGGSSGGGGSSDSPGAPFNANLNDALITTPQESINDALLDGPGNFPINTTVLKSGKAGTGGKADVHGGGVVLAFACKVGGRDMLTLHNAGAPVPAGTKVRWDVASLGEHGVVRLKSDLDTGDSVRVATQAGLDAGTPCAAKAI